jgi:hypothetical protein
MSKEGLHSVIFAMGVGEEMYHASSMVSLWAQKGYAADVIDSNRDFNAVLDVVTNKVERRLEMSKDMTLVGADEAGLVVVSALNRFSTSPVTVYTIGTDLDFATAPERKISKFEADGRNHLGGLLARGTLPVTPDRVINMVTSTNSQRQQLPGARVVDITSDVWNSPVTNGLYQLTEEISNGRR